MSEFVPTIAHIVCFDKGFNIGVVDKDTNQYYMPWGHTLKGDLKRFKELTQNNIVIMGTNTYKSIGKPLPNRINIIVSTTYNYLDSKNVYVRDNLDDALTLADYLAHRDQKDIFIIGGSSIYEQTSHLISKAYITAIDTDYTHRPFKFNNYALTDYNTFYLSSFKIQSVQLHKEPYFIPNIYFTTWVKSSSNSLE